VPEGEGRFGPLTAPGFGVTMEGAVGTALFAMGFVLASVASLVGVVRAIDRAEGPDEHLSLAIRFWRRVSLVGGAVAAIFAYALWSAPLGFGAVAATTFVLMSLPPVVVLAVGIRNRRLLLAERRRRRAALSAGVPGRASITAARPVPFAQDLVEVTAQVEVTEGAPPVGYRARPRPAGRAQVRAVLPAELARTLQPGVEVPVHLDPSEPEAWTPWPDAPAPRSLPAG